MHPVGVGVPVPRKEVTLTLKSILKKQGYKENIGTSNEYDTDVKTGTGGVRPSMAKTSRNSLITDFYETTGRKPSRQPPNEESTEGKPSRKPHSDDDIQIVGEYESPLPCDHVELHLNDAASPTKRVRFRETVTCAYTEDMDDDFCDKSFESLRIADKSTRQKLMSVARKLDRADSSTDEEPFVRTIRKSKRNNKGTDEVQVLQVIPAAVAATGPDSSLTSLNRRGGTGNPGLDVWISFMSEKENRKWVAPVSFFVLAPLGDVWDDIVQANIGHKFEMPNFKAESKVPTYKVATVIEFCGYLTLAEVGEKGKGRTHLHWINFFDGMAKYIGYGAENGIPRYERNGIQDLPKSGSANPDPFDLTLSIDRNHTEFVREQIKICQIIKLGEVIEVLDHTNISQMRLATVTKCVGNRVLVTHVTKNSPSGSGAQASWWYSVHSTQIRPLGWSKAIGQRILEAEDARTDTRIDLSFIPKWPEAITLFEGQLLEACNPQKMDLICAASVHTVLKHGYFLAAFSNVEYEERGPTLFCFHITSPSIFPCGFCEHHGIDLVQPYSCRELSPQAYLRYSRTLAAPLHLIGPRRLNPFKVGMKLEAVDLGAPDYLGPATVTKIAGHMMFLKYDGWFASGWMPCHSTDIYPAGYCGLVGDTIRYPPNPVKPEHASENATNSIGPKKRGRKRHI